VVIPVGLWRKIGSYDHHGLRLVRERGGAYRVVLDNDGIPTATRESGERELLREHVRLLYVTLTRAQRALVIPWPVDTGPEDVSFGALWNLDPRELDPLEPAGALTAPEPVREPLIDTAPIEGARTRAPELPSRILPHALGGSQDLARAARHESALDQVFPAKDGPDPLEYGVWWHKTLEFLPWSADESAVTAYCEAYMAEADSKGFGERGREEWRRLLDSEPWKLMRNARWTRLAEVGIFAPLGSDGWIDGVIDLVLLDSAAGELWIVDWKTNRRNPSEDDPALLARLSAEYEKQLEAYGACASGFFPGSSVSLWVYSTVAGSWIKVASPG
jgi:ATP-dependent exoDNAse (exonuclease V) beta subunit